MGHPRGCLHRVPTSWAEIGRRRLANRLAAGYGRRRRGVVSGASSEPSMRDGRRTCLLAIVAVLALSSAACGGSGGGCIADKATALSGPLTMHGRAFNPDCFKVASGSTISVDNRTAWRTRSRSKRPTSISASSAAGRERVGTRGRHLRIHLLCPPGNEGRDRRYQVSPDQPP
jgi:hypothetical protein